jgi:hypothetical protein
MTNQNGTGRSVYKGTERRKMSRRFTADRRKEVRWEPSKSPRRATAGRRTTDQLSVFDKR